MGMILFPNISCFVPNWLVDYMDDLPKLNQYASPQAMHKWLIDDISQTATLVQEK